ncbi:hypothetical protein M3Y94_01153500 [Aphelenchoides besseyi]|nr:hypothetical protein M3Y94_01153500 [Aphelenchoides besseyi]KAI6227990.1 hypothetical protein M3Y95_00575100 [Aphelenchoides besseyi]
MDYGDDVNGVYGGNNDDNVQGDDFAVAQRLQRQFDDEDCLTAQMASSFNFLAPRPDFPQATSSSNYGDTSSRADEQIARRLQRNFFLELKRQGLSDLDMASMLDTQSLHQPPPVDLDLQLALQASLGEELPNPSTNSDGVTDIGPSFVEKFLLFLYNNSQYDFNAQNVLPLTDELSEFRRQVRNSACELADASLMGGQKVVEVIMEKGVKYATQWNELESAFFILESVCERLFSSDFDAYTNLLVSTITKIKPNENSILINTTNKLIAAISSHICYNTETTISLLQWLLKIPPYEVVLVSMCTAVERVVTHTRINLHNSFTHIYDFLPYVELSKEKGSEMEMAALCLIRACVRIVNEEPNESMYQMLSMLVEKPLKRLHEIANVGPRRKLISFTQGESWHQLAEQPFVWLSRISTIFENFRSSYLPQSYFEEDVGREVLSICQQLYHKTIETIGNVITVFSSDKTIVERCCLTSITVIESNSSSISSSNCIDLLVEKMLNVYSAHPDGYLLNLVDSLFDKNITNLNARNFDLLNEFCTKTFQHFQSPQSIKENISLLNQLFKLVLMVARFRFAQFVVAPVVETLLEVSIFGLEIEADNFHVNARDFCLLFIQFRAGSSPSEALQTATELVRGLLAKHGDNLFRKCIQFQIGDYSYPLKDSAAAILVEFIWTREEEMRAPMTTCLQQLFHANLAAIPQVPILVDHLMRCTYKAELMELFEQFIHGLN